MKLEAIIISDTLYIALHIPLVDKSLQFHLFQITNIPLIHLALQRSFQYTIHEEYLAIRLDRQYISFPFSTDIMACQVSKGKFCHNNTPYIQLASPSPAAIPYSSKNRNKINTFSTLSVINQTHDKDVNINDILGESQPWKAIKSFTLLAFSTVTH